MLTGLALSVATASLLSAPPELVAEAGPTDAPQGLPMARTQREAIISHHQLQLHQGFALATLGLMAINSGLGIYDVYFTPPQWLPALHNVHVALGGATTALYLGAATLALTAPQGYDSPDEAPMDSVAVHENLAWLHAAGLGATVVLGELAALNKVDPLYHGLAGGATFALMAASAGVIALDF